MAVGQILHSPAEVRGVDPEHRGALADRRREKEDFLVGRLALEAIDQIQFGPDRPSRPGRRGTHGLDDELGRSDEVGLVDDILVAFRMDDNLALRILLAKVIHMRRLKHLVHAAMALPEDQLGAFDGVSGIPAVGLIGVPHDHFITGDTHCIRCIAPQVLVGEEQNFLTPGPTPFDHRARIGRRTGNASVFAAKSLEHRRRVHVHGRHDRLLDRHHTAQRFPALIDLLDRRHVRHRAAGGHIGQNHGLIRPAEDIRRFGHKMHTAEHNVRPVGSFGGQF